RVVVLAEPDREIERRGAADIALGEVLAAAEAASRAGEQHGANLLLVDRALERGAQQTLHFRIERVQLLRPVERNGEHAGVERDEDGRHGIRILPCRSSTPSTAWCRSSIRALSSIRARCWSAM